MTSLKLACLSLILMASCGQNKDFYLYDSDSTDPKYLALKARQQTKCLSNSPILKSLSNANDISQFNKKFPVGSLFRSEEKLGDKIPVVNFFKILSVVGTVVTFQVNSTKSS